MVFCYCTNTFIQRTIFVRAKWNCFLAKNSKQKLQADTHFTNKQLFNASAGLIILVNAGWEINNFYANFTKSNGQ